MPLSLFAPAKINLALHVTGRRDDGFHLIDSLVVFARDVGDRVTVDPTQSLGLTVTGDQAGGVPADRDNLVLRAAERLGAAASAPISGHITLEKAIPAAGGLGGGSSDAAAALRLFSKAWATTKPLPPIAAALGADVPMCLDTRPVRARGIGEDLAPVPVIPTSALVLVNPGVPVDTGAVYRGLESPVNAPLPVPDWTDRHSFHRWLAATRNDLEPPALAIAPAIGAVLGAVSADPAVRLARMSGSGGSCFGLFDDRASAEAAAARLRAHHPRWWVRVTEIATTTPAISARD